MGLEDNRLALGVWLDLVVLTKMTRLKHHRTFSKSAARRRGCAVKSLCFDPFEMVGNW